MCFTWIDFGTSGYEAEIDSWSTDADTIRYATDDPISEEYAYYIDNPDYDEDARFCKVILENGRLIAVIIILSSESYPTAINPIIINPAYRNRGYCTRIINELISNTREIIRKESNFFEAGIYLNNKASIRAFEKAGFVMVGTHASGDFTYWVYPASKLESYREYCVDSMGDKFIVYGDTQRP